MLLADLQRDTGSGQLVLLPNRSSSWQNIQRFIIISAALTLLIGVVFALLGAWLILPFAGLEVLALVILLYYVSCKQHCQEVITISDTYITVEKGVRFPRMTWQCERFWCRLYIYSQGHPWYSEQIRLRCQDKEVEVGSFLTVDEKQDLIKKLKQLLPHV